MYSEPDNGILASLGGDDIAAGIGRLPLAETHYGQERLAVDIDTERQGRVRISYILNCHQHHRSRHFFWTAYHARRLEPPAAPADPAT